MEGRTATEMEPNSTAAQEIKALVKEITAVLKDDDDESGEQVSKSAKKKTLIPA
jgi:hypothetical protein